MIRIEVPWDPARTSRNTLDGRHWAKKLKAYQAAQQTARWAWIAAGSPRAPGAVRVSLTSHRPRKMDPDGLLAACKPLFDGLFKQAVTPDDSARWIELGEVKQVIYTRGPKVVFEIEPRVARATMKPRS